MPALIDAVTLSGNLANLTTKTWSHTCTGTNRFLLIGLAGFDFNSNMGGITITYNGVAVPRLGGQWGNDSNSTILWGLKNPASGANNIVVSSIPANFLQLGGGAISLTGVHQTTATGTVVNSQGLSVNIPSVVTGDLVADIFYVGDNVDANPTSPGVKRLSQPGDLGNYNIMSTRGGSGTVNTGYTGTSDRAISGVRIIQSEALGAFSGAIIASGELMAGTASVLQALSGSPDAQNAVIAGRANDIHFLGDIASQAAVIVGDGLRITLHFDGAIAAQAPLIEDLLSAHINANGVVLSDVAVTRGVIGDVFSGIMLSDVGVISGSATVERIRPPDNTDVRYGRIGHGRRFAIWIDQSSR